MGVAKDVLRLNRLKSKVYRHTCRHGASRRCRFFYIAPRRVAFSRAEESDSSRTCVVRRSRCGRLSSIYMYFPLFLVIILREEKLSRDSTERILGRRPVEFGKTRTCWDNLLKFTGLIICLESIELFASILRQCFIMKESQHRHAL
jgi:hypothetical protein